MRSKREELKSEINDRNEREDSKREIKLLNLIEKLRNSEEWKGETNEK